MTSFNVTSVVIYEGLGGRLSISNYHSIKYIFHSVFRDRVEKFWEPWKCSGLMLCALSVAEMPRNETLHIPAGTRC